MAITAERKPEPDAAKLKRIKLAEAEVVETRNEVYKLREMLKTAKEDAETAEKRLHDTINDDQMQLEL